MSSVATGEYANAIELNAIQRSNPEMQKRVMNVIRALQESSENPIISIHDHGAGGHLNCLSELLEESGGEISVSKLPVGDPTLSEKEIIGNESQERMGMVLKQEDIDLVAQVWEASSHMQQYVDVHLVIDGKQPWYKVGTTDAGHGRNPYPVNLLRQLSVEYAATEWIIYVEAV